jgi:ketosteroid isomerase-like protein
MEPNMNDDLTAQLIDLEHARCVATSNGDAAALVQMNTDDLTYTHTTGIVDDIESLLASLDGVPRQITRGDDLRVRFYGDVAVMTGSLTARFPTPQGGGGPLELETQALQVWVKSGESWKQAAFAASGQLPAAMLR